MANLFHMLELEPTLFDDIVYPEQLDKDTIINTILDECLELEPMTLVPGYLKARINSFFKKHKEDFDRLAKLWFSKYEPLENYDRIETGGYTDSHSGSDKTTLKNGRVITDTGDVSAMDSSDYSPKTRDISKASGEDITTDEYGHQIKHTSDLRVHGNIGVTTSQQMALSEVELWTKFNIYDVIANEFAKEIMICVL